MKRDLEFTDTETPGDGDSDEGIELDETDIDSSEFFCRFTPMQLDRMAEVWLGERPLCERWISRDGKTAILYPLRIKYNSTPGISGRQFGERVDLRKLWTETVKQA